VPYRAAVTAKRLKVNQRLTLPLWGRAQRDKAQVSANGHLSVTQREVITQEVSECYLNGLLRYKYNRAHMLRHVYSSSKGKKYFC
jgi:hypothetical protein